ncbi:hypothetical protein [Phaffia rhodozyma]|uniref:Uncharacterized protein n=1 Tax=Phaffia rhodozyma TaxID=264483 RepID=A0A0F7SRA9_PHARH|nr:hypothetical protein [Phaffia rhodozyma]
MSTGPSNKPLRQLSSDVSLLASLPNRTSLLSLLPDAPAYVPPVETLVKHAPPEAPPTTKEDSLVFGKSFLKAVRELQASGVEKDLDQYGSRVDQVREKLENVKEGLDDGLKISRACSPSSLHKAFKSWPLTIRHSKDRCRTALMIRRRNPP